MDKIKKVVI